MIDPRYVTHPFPACLVLELFRVSGQEVTKRLGVSRTMWTYWRTGQKRPSAKQVWAITFLAGEAMKQAARLDRDKLNLLAKAQWEFTMEFAGRLMALQHQENCALPPAARISAERTLQPVQLPCLHC